jgi:hypothetical protein
MDVPSSWPLRIRVTVKSNPPPTSALHWDPPQAAVGIPVITEPPPVVVSLSISTSKRSSAGRLVPGAASTPMLAVRGKPLPILEVTRLTEAISIPEFSGSPVVSLTAITFPAIPKRNIQPIIKTIALLFIFLFPPFPLKLIKKC